MIQPRRSSEAYDGGYGDFCFYFKGSRDFSDTLIALALGADGSDPEIN